MTDLTALARANKGRWEKMRFVRGNEFSTVARRLVASKARYLPVSSQTGVPWFIIAVIHEREAGQDWAASLAQGDPWDRRSVHVPKGRGPFANWREAAVDALVNCAPYAARWKDWSAGGALTLLEQYNGLGYSARGLPSPYLWSGTDQYVRGKYVRDGVFDANAIDQQLGCAGLIRAMMQLDPTIAFTGGRVIPPPDPPQPEPPSTPPPRSALAAFLCAIQRLFKRR